MLTTLPLALQLRQHARPLRLRGGRRTPLHYVTLPCTPSAFYKAAQRGFELGHELGDWIEAEQEGVQIRKKIPIDLQAMEICR